jgi:heme exporter protein D
LLLAIVGDVQFADHVELGSFAPVVAVAVTVAVAVAVTVTITVTITVAITRRRRRHARVVAPTREKE